MHFAFCRSICRKNEGVELRNLLQKFNQMVTTTLFIGSILIIIKGFVVALYQANMQEIFR